MLSRDNYQFVLHPWENQGVLFDSRPQFVESAQVHGYTHIFLLKVRGNRVFFRFGEDETRIWATTSEIEGDAVSFWRREVEAGRIARLFSYRGRLDLSRGFRTTETGVLVSAEDEVWFCEWCSDLWLRGQLTLELRKYTRTHRKLSVWQPQWQPPLRKLWNLNADMLLNRFMPESEREATSFRWVCGSREQLEELLNHLCFACFDTIITIERKLN